MIQEAYNVGKSTIYDLKSNKETILQYAAECQSANQMEKRKTMKPAKFDELDRVLYEWFKQRRCEGIPISGFVLREKAREFHQTMDLEECQFSDGWLRNFRKRYGIKHLKVSGEKNSADTEAAENYAEVFNKMVMEDKLLPSQIYNADETGLLWRCIPRNTLATNQENNISGWKESKERVTVLCCANASGSHKLKLLVVGKSMHPRCFKNSKVLPVHYTANKRAWMTRNIFTEWFTQHFVPAVRQNCEKEGLSADCKIVLLLDNCSAHPPVLEKDNVFVKYLPPNCTSLIQPMDQGIIRSMKCHYRKSFLKKIISSIDSMRDLKSDFNLKDCVWTLARAWENVTTDTLKNTWHNLWPATLFMEESDVEENNFEGFAVETNEVMRFAHGFVQEDCLREWMDCDADLPIVNHPTDNEIIEMVTGTNVDVEDSDDENGESSSPPPKFSMQEGLKLMEDCITFMETNKNVSEQEVMSLYRVHERLTSERNKNLKQTTLKDFISKK